jgi:hypothetical protein
MELSGSAAEVSWKKVSASADNISQVLMALPKFEYVGDNTTSKLKTYASNHEFSLIQKSTIYCMNH